MSWKDKCAAALGEMRLYENSGHKTRFMELMECYSGYPFFTKGLCKCMYLSAWDEEHFAVMLEMLTSMALGEEHDTEDMKFQGDVIADEKIDEHAYGEAYVFNFRECFWREIREYRRAERSCLRNMNISSAERWRPAG